jgi:hypothetical protein
MHPALFKLTYLLFKGWVRRQFSGGSIKRTVAGIVAAVMFLLWFGNFAVWTAFGTAMDPRDTLMLLPAILTALALVPILLGNDDRALAFTPAEIDFLFPGPFSRRDLVLSKLLRITLGALLGSIFFGMAFRRFAAWVPLSFVGAALALVFVNLLTTVVALVRDTVRERWYNLARFGALVLLLGAAGGVVWYTSTMEAPTLADFRALGESTPVRVVLAPARVFAHVFASRGIVEAVPWVLACLGMIGAALLAVLALDKGYMSAALAASERRQARLARLGKGGIKTGRPARAISIPNLHALGAAGAIIQRQFITAVRTSRAWIIAFVIALAYGYLMSRLIGHGGSGAPDGAHEARGLGTAALLPAFVMIGLMLPQMIRFDFRGDLDNMESLKALPITPVGAAIAELAVPTLILSAQGWVIVAGVAAFVGLPARALAMACLAVVPIAVVLFALENFVFLLVPTRIFAQGQAANVFSGRRLLYMLARMGLLMVGTLAVGGAGLIAWFTTGSVWVTFAACWIALCAIAAGLIPAVAWAFARFDVSVDMPA